MASPSPVWNPGPLWHACHRGDLEEVRRLLDALPSMFFSPLSWLACKIGGVDELKVDPRSEGLSMSPLFVAAAEGHEVIVALLLDNWADVSGRGKSGLSALHMAAGKGHIGTTALLLDRGADIHAKKDISLPSPGFRKPPSPNEGYTPLGCAIASGHADVARLLVERGADVADIGIDENMACTSASTAAGRRPAARREGPGPHIGKTRTWPALHVAAGGCGLDVVKWLVAEHGADVSAKSENGMTALHAVASARGGRAAAGQQTGVARFLVEQGADISARDDKGKTPLDYAKDRYKPDPELLQALGEGA